MKQRHTARSVALRALLQVEKSAGYSNLVLDNALESAGLSELDRGLAAAIFYGVLERRLTLDYYLRQCLKNPKQRLDPTVREALRCGAYQILYLDRVPDSAAVNETVNALKLVGKGQLSGFVNGVLRGLNRKREEIKLPEGSSLSAMSLRYSVPQDLVRLWRDSYGKAVTLRLLESLQAKPELYVRVNTYKCSAEKLKESLEKDGVKLDILPAPANAGILTGCGSPSGLGQFKQGLFHVQDLSAQWVCKILDLKPGNTVCDCCAAPGGKTFTLAQEVGLEGKVYAFDLYDSRVGLIQEGAKRLGLDNVIAQANDATQGLAHMPAVDKMLCDVPCSGFGVIRRKPEIRYKPLDSIKELPALQYEILCQGAQAVKPNGLLVYSTCTLNPAENSRVVERFLSENNGFEPMTIDIGVRHSIDEPDYMLTMTSFGGASDGFFAAAFRKR